MYEIKQLNQEFVVYRENEQVACFPTSKEADDYVIGQTQYNQVHSEIEKIIVE